MAEELDIAERRLMFEALRKKSRYVSLIPSFVLGLVDSALMIFASESINSSFAAVYGMSIMSAAALGNIATSIVLLQTQVHFGHLIERFGLNGSICGLFPLFFYDNLTAEEIQRKARASAYMIRENYEAGTLKC
ncbi:hypothetical protein COOONC_13038 [Cooperia oncophora]